MQTIGGDEYYDVNEATALLGIKRATLYAYVSRGVLHSYKQGVGRQRLYKRSEVDALLAVRPSGEGATVQQNDASSLPFADTWTGDH
jgi:citrate synthase